MIYSQFLLEQILEYGNLELNVIPACCGTPIDMDDKVK